MKYTLAGTSPSVDPGAFVAPSADVIGNVRIGTDSSIWFGAVARGDVNRIRIGTATNVQDGSVLHVRHNIPLRIGDRVTVGHGVTLHACEVEDETLLGIGSVLLDNVTVGTRSIVGAGSVVTPGTEVESGSLYMGTPAQKVRDLKDDELEMIGESAQNYVRHTREYLEGLDDGS